MIRLQTDQVRMNHPVQLQCTFSQAGALRATAKRLGAKVTVLCGNFGSEIRQEIGGMEESSLQRMFTEQEVSQVRRRKRKRAKWFPAQHLSWEQDYVLVAGENGREVTLWF